MVKRIIEDEQLSPADVRCALDEILASEMFRHSPQLASFLKFIVEASLDGDRGRIKGYSIGVEALGRSESFDPQIDPIVRVEATRFRRALERYYAGLGGRGLYCVWPLAWQLCSHHSPATRKPRKRR